ncbi:DUF21 domain-containing protein [candidate division KSB1 bacterium]|nr:DUF21 domain-containing protein [candidate division KSB1 bacterium]
MESDSYLQIFLFAILILFSAFFSSAETAFFSLTRISLNRLKEKNDNKSKRVLRLLKQPRNLLITILTGNTIVNVAAASIAALLAADLSHNMFLSEAWVVLIEVVVVTLILLVLSEITPKIFAVKNAIWLAEYYSLPIQIVSAVLYPIVQILAQFPFIVSKLIGPRVDKHLLSKEELKTLLEVGKDRGALIEDEKRMIHSIFEFAQTSAKEIMIPRTDMICVEKNTPIDELIQIIKEKGHTRLPVYEERVDNIVGVLHAKELLPLLKSSKDKIDLEKRVRPALFVPESKMIDELLKDFQKEKMHMAIVVDEYGGTAGLITLEDVIEEIVGEIQDEYDREKPLYKKNEDGSFMVNAKMNIDELKEQLKLNIVADDSYESLGGHILNITGSLPEPGEEVIDQGYKFVIEKVEKNRIIQVRIMKITEKDEKTS